MEVEIIHGQIVAKANHYQAVPGKFGKKRIIKDEVIRAYEHSFMEQCKVSRNRRMQPVSGCLSGYGIVRNASSLQYWK